MPGVRCAKGVVTTDPTALWPVQPSWVCAQKNAGCLNLHTHLPNLSTAMRLTTPVAPCPDDTGPETAHLP
eukprot:2638072-Alexandrium_andersonii.AAC.1